MKRTICLLLILLQNTFLFSQDIESISREEKSIVYFTRTYVAGKLINFTYFDGEKAIGQFKCPKYLKYECKPGKHLFWARSENKSFVEADLKAGEIYVIDVIAKMGAIKVGVKLIPVDKSNYKMKKIQKLISKQGSETFNESELIKLQDDMTEVIIKGMEKYNKLKQKGKKIVQLKPEMTVSKEDLIFIKK